MTVVGDACAPVVFVGAHPLVVALRDAVIRYAARPWPVLILGESGTGKELVASWIHQASRRPGRLVPVNCAQLKGDLLVAEIFGHRKGAFTGATEHREGLARAARGGTLFLDEIGDLGPDGQEAILRLLEAREVRPVGGTTPEQVDVRFVAATHRDQHAMVHDGRFRDDLLHRLSAFEVQIPPLRDRSSDIPAVARALLDRFASDLALSAEVSAWLMRQRWPGNVRELFNVLRRAEALCDDRSITVACLERARGGHRRTPVEAPLLGRDRERVRLGWEIVRCEPRVSEREVTRRLGLQRSTWRSTLAREGLTWDRFLALAPP